LSVTKRQRIQFIERSLIIVRLMMLCIVVCLLAVNAASGIAGENCTLCHPVALKGIHAALSCTSCHGDKGDKVKAIGNPVSAVNGTDGCVGCHKGYELLFNHAMATRSREKLFIERTVGRNDPDFSGKTVTLATCAAVPTATGERDTRSPRQPTGAVWSATRDILSEPIIMVWRPVRIAFATRGERLPMAKHT
jgi:hypothetical protein